MKIFTHLARLAFGLTVIFAPFRWRIILEARPNPPVYGDFTNFLLFASDIFLLLTLAFWVLSPSFVWTNLKRGPIYIWLPLAGLTLAAWISVFISEDRALSIHHAWRLLFLFGFYFYIVNEIQSLEWVAVPVGLQMALQSFVALGQSVLQASLGWGSLGEPTLDPKVAGVSVVVADGVRFLRAYGLTDHPNILGGCLAFGLVLLLAVLVGEGNKEIESASIRVHPRPIVIALIFLPSLLALLLTFSRSAWIAFLGGSLLIVTIEAARKNWIGLKRVALLALVGAAVVLPVAWRVRPFIGVRLNQNDSFATSGTEIMSLGERAYLILAANRIFVDHSLTGIGLATAPEVMKDYYPDFPVNYQPPHFTLLAVAVETGVLGGVPYFLLGFLPWLALIVDRKRMTANPFSVAAAGLLLAVGAVGWFDYYPWTYATGRVWQWLAWGLWSAAEANV